MSDAEQNLVAWMSGQGMHDSAGLVERLTAERDALRALLGEVRKMAENGVLYNEPLNARIDAALNKGGGDE